MSSSVVNDGEYQSQALVDVARIAKITRQLYERQQFAYVLVDLDWKVIETSANLAVYGFKEMPVGNDARDSIDFLVGLDSSATLDLPIVMSPSGHPMHIVLLPEDDNLTIVLMDASVDYEQKQLLQQKANENELLLARQRKLTDDLEATQAALVRKNRELEEASRLQSSFLSGASHEFRTPLAALLGYVEMLGERFTEQPHERSLDQLNVVRRSAKHLLSLVENLLDHGKLDAEEMIVNPRPSDMQELCNEVEAMLQRSARNKQIELSFSSIALPVCLVDDSRVRQILLNVIGNAIKFTDEGRVSVSLGWADQVLHIEVEDTGIGIGAEDLHKILQPFWQVAGNERVGTGLGLTITSRVVEMLGGDLSISSELSQGTKVLISIPAPQVNPEQLNEQSKLIQSFAAGKFLLAEDDQDIAALLKLLLEERGMQVTLVENGELAVEAASKEDFDVILMDLQMPVLNGYAATRRLREAGVMTPVLVMTASAIEADRTMAERAGCDGYLVKPVAVDELLSLANDLLAGSSLVANHAQNG